MLVKQRFHHLAVGLGLSRSNKTCGACETCGTMAPMELDESDSIAPLEESLHFMPSDDEEQRRWKKRSIYRVPARITALDREVCQPQVVSFGPYHHGKDCLLPMEEHKCRAVLHFLKRSKKPIEPFFESLREVAWDLEESYDALDPKWKAASGEGAARRFLELLITDGCFMLEILRFKAEEVDDYAPNDPIFSDHGSIHIMLDIYKDMLMLENQLPMLVLDRLVAVESDGKKDDELVSKLFLKFFSFPTKGITRIGKCLHFLDVFRNSMLMEPEKKDEEDDESVNRFILKFCSPSKGITWMGKCLHVLDVVRNSMLMEPKKEDKVKREDSEEIIQLASATELSQHGIKFKRSKTDSIKDISFAGGVLTLPKIRVDEITMSYFLNLTAFEYLHVGTENEVMSYIYGMDQIINNGQDVALLRAKGIIMNYMESDEAVAEMFNSLGKVVGINLSPSLTDVIKKVNKYRNKHWNRWRANLIHHYLRNPWVALSLIAAVFLFTLTIIQTIYSVLGYYK